MEVNYYRSVLRVSCVIFALLVLFDSGILFPITRELSDTTLNYLGAVGVGMNAEVPANELNTLSAQIAEEQRVLDAREAALREREIQARDFGTTGSDIPLSTYVFSVILFILTVLLVFNYAMDIVRSRAINYAK